LEKEQESYIVESGGKGDEKQKNIVIWDVKERR